MSEEIKQFTTLALSYSSESNVMIFDNPTSSLDDFKRVFLYEIHESYKKNIPFFSSLVCSNDGLDISRMCDTFNIIMNGAVSQNHKLHKFLNTNNRECKLVVHKNPDSYDITVRVKNTLAGFDYEI